ncbi:hypothetical protein H9L13_07495 [Sphingomonas lutea]|uniref:Uncharacterized protein n=1 Tax=Sphingomonas lutea TaxID=1045317 RepID=A0A7G9SFD2_9SPHN|nr:hypothetical protein [Sphingomonas lutea]QNN66557.1 hypothetical protein H9L13_07495 [Sphingomonas lutea]
MAANRSLDPKSVGLAEAQLARVATEGCARHPHLKTLLEAVGPNCGRDLADAVHLLCHLHGRYPGLIEVALQRAPSSAAQAWLQQASDGFERERLYLVRLTASVGPLPSTPGAAETEASLSSARNALETLATSERMGCALGAATALVGDWWPIRRMLDRAASRAGLDCPAPSLPNEASIVEVIHRASETPASERALAFGGEQLLLQHRGLFDLLEARTEARSGY